MENRIEDVEEIDTLIAELEISRGKGNLILCVVNSPLYRDKIILTLKGRFSSNIVSVINGEQIISILKKKDFNNADILMWIMPEEPNDDLLNTLNNFRELFYEGKSPNVVFYNQAFSENVIRKAPDFWRYRGNYYEFKDEERDLTFEAIGVLTTPLTYNDKEDLLRRGRINEYLLEKVHDKVEKGDVLNELGLIFHHLGELVKALGYFQKELELNEKLGKKERFSRPLRNIGIIHLNKGELDTALEYFNKALEIDEKLGLKEGVAANLRHIGIVNAIKGELNKALEYFNKALEIDEKLGFNDGVAKDLESIGIVFQIRGELDKALEYYQKALRIFEGIGNRIEAARALMNIGDVTALKREKKRALDYYLKAQNAAKGSSISESIAKRLRRLKKEEIAKV